MDKLFERPFRILITSGGIKVSIDDVRYIGNKSKGTTGALIAEEFLKRGIEVDFIYGQGTKQPFLHRVKTDLVSYKKYKHAEIKKIESAMDDYLKHWDQLMEYEIVDFDDFYATVQQLLLKNKYDAAIMLAAVPDYKLEKVEGKISSDLEEMILKLQKTPKVLMQLKNWNSMIFQVGFKLLSGVSLEELIDTAYRQGIKSRNNLTVANVVGSDSLGSRKIVIITPEKSLTPVELSNFAVTIVDTVIQRVSKKHFRTEISKDEDMNEDSFSIFAGLVRNFWKYNLFEPYFDNCNMHFGFVAQRVSGSRFLITARGSDKQICPKEDIVWVDEVDFENRVVHARSLSGKKPSLNANVAARIFQQRPDINLILHAHVFPALENETEIDYAPGTEEDMLEVSKYFENGEKAVSLKGHGVMIGGVTFEDIISQLEFEPCYTKFPWFYDIVYARFNKRATFVDLVEMTLSESKNDAIVDLACGTGEVALALSELGFGDLTLVDKNQEMLDVALDKMEYKFPTFHQDIFNLKLDRKYDCICVRQAINYLMDETGLRKGLRRIRENLKIGGYLIFNAPNYDEFKLDGSREKSYKYTAQGYRVMIEEMNLFKSDILTHTQRCQIMKEDGSEIRKFYDLNRFGMFTQKQFVDALMASGFRYVRMYDKNLDHCFHVENTKSIYVVAQK